MTTPRAKKAGALRERPKSWRSISDYFAGLSDGSSRSGVKASAESLMSLMSSSGGTSASPLSPRLNRRGLRSVSSGASSRGSFVELPRMSQGLGSRSFPQGFDSTSALMVADSLPAALSLRPFFPLDPGDLDTPFLGREWLAREIQESLLRRQEGAKALAIHGVSGCGKTTFLRQLALASRYIETVLGKPVYRLLFSFHSAPCDAPGSFAGSRLSLTSQNLLTTAAQPSLIKSVGERVVAYHFCRVDWAESCNLHDYIANLAAQLASSPLLPAYAQCLAKDEKAQARLGMPAALGSDPLELFQTCVASPLRAARIRPDAPLLILVDALDEADFHRPEAAEGLPAFLARHAHLLPCYMKLVVTLRSSSLGLVEELCERAVALDDVGLDERLWRDGLSYAHARLSAAPGLRETLNSSIGAADGMEGAIHFCEYVAGACNGDLLYLRRIFDLLQSGQLRLKSANYGSLPQRLGEVLLLNLNLRFPSVRAFEAVQPLLSVLAATLRPLPKRQLFDVINAGRTSELLSWEFFCEKLERLGDLVIERGDGTLILCHPSLRDWLLRRPDGASHKFLADLRLGHALLALHMTRRGSLTADSMVELGHHLLKAHPYKHLPAALASVAAGRDCQLLWLTQAAADLHTALIGPRNLAAPNIKVCRLLLLAGASAEAVVEGEPILVRASGAGHADLVALLLEFGASVSGRNTDTGRTALMAAAAGGHLDVVQLLHQHKAKLESVSSSGRSALVLAGGGGHVAVVSFLLQCDWEEGRAEAVQSAFVAAAAAGMTKVVQFLLETSGEVRLEAACGLTGQSALCAACSSARAETAQYLIACGANNNVTAAPLPLVALSNTETPLICAVAGGSWEIVSGLLAKGIEADSERGLGGCTALMTAAGLGHIGVIQLLLSRDAGVDLCDDAGRTALAHAAQADEAACAGLLLDRGASLDAVDSVGETALHVAGAGGGRQLVQLLLERGARLEALDAQGRRPLDRAVQTRNRAALAVFLRKGAKLGPTTWKLAAEAPEIALILLNKLQDDASLLYRRGRVKDAAHRFAYALKKLPGDWRGRDSPLPADLAAQAAELRAALLLGHARCRRRLGDFQGSLELSSELLAEADGEEEHFQAHFLRAKTYFDMQDSSAARSSAEAALALRPSSREARHLLQSLAIALPEDGLPAQVGPVSPLAGKARGSPADCSSDSGNQADFEEAHRLLAGCSSP